MGMFHGSMRHSSSGKRKKNNYWKKSKGCKGGFVPMETSSVYRRETPNYPSRDDRIGSTARVEPQKYTVTLVKGISTMHKSNAVPIVDEQEAKEHASMRR